MLLVLLCFTPPRVLATPQSVGTANGGLDILWNNSDGNGAVDLWISSTGLLGSSDYTARHTYGPYPDWSAKAIAAGTDQVPRILWTKTDGSAALWRVDASGGFTQTTYGPYPGWTAQGLSIGGDNLPRLLWTKTDGMMAVWNVAANGSFTQTTYGPYPGYTASMIAVGANNIPRVLWTKTDGSISVWNGLSGTAGYSHAEYGPFPGYALLSMVAGGFNNLRLLWNHPSDGTVSLWQLATSGTYTYGNYTNPAGSSPVSISSDTSYYSTTQILYAQPDSTSVIRFLDMFGSLEFDTPLAPPGASTGGGGGSTGTATPNPHGSYSVVYSYNPGLSSSTDGAAGIGALSTYYDQNYGGTIASADVHFSGTQTGNAAAHFKGTFTATFTWHGDSAHPNSPAPAQVTVIKRCQARWQALFYSNFSGSCSTGLGQSGTNPPNLNYDSATSYAAEVKGGASFFVNYTPTADVYGTGGSGNPGGATAQAAASFSAAAVVMNLAGTTLRTLDNTDAMLIGQQCTASLAGLPGIFSPGGSLQNNVSYSWTVSGTAFHQWSQTTPLVGNNPPNLSASFYDPITGQPSLPTPNQLTLPTPQWHWNDPGAATEKVTCTATLTPPSGQGSSFPLTLPTQTVNVQVPSVNKDNNFVGAGYVGSYNNDSSSLGLYAGATPQMVADKKMQGSTWRTTVTMPAAPNYSGPGYYGYAQLITPGEYLTGNDNVEVASDATKAGEGLDALFPYRAANFTADSTSYDSGDTPAIQLDSSIADTNFKAARLSDSFKVYLMFLPPGTGSNWVPLAESEWATNNPDLKAIRPSSGHWASYPPSQSVGNVYLIQDFRPWHDYPKWTLVHPANAPFTKPPQ